MSDDKPVDVARRNAQRWTETRKRNHLWALRADEEENATLEALFDGYKGSVESRVYGESKGGFLRYLCLAKDAQPVRKIIRTPSAHPSAKELLMVRNDIALALSNLNQMAHAMNRHQMPVSGHLREKITALDDVIKRITSVLDPPVTNDTEAVGTAYDRQG